MGPFPRYAGSLIMWTWQDDQVERHQLLDDALADIAAHGFSGALAMLRGCRYPVSDPLVIAAAQRAAEQAHRRDLRFWFALDPRLDQGRLIDQPGGRARYLLTGRDPAGALPCEAPVDDAGRFRIRIPYGRPRRQHMLSQVAITYEPEAVELAVAYRKTADGTVLTGTIRDVSVHARLFVQRGSGHLEIFGQLPPPSGADWHVLALPRCRSTYPELGSDAVLTALGDLYRAYHRAGVALDGVFWDEIGYVTGYGQDRSRLPWSAAVQAAFAARCANDPGSRLPYLLLDDDAGHAAGTRNDYYRAVQDVVTAATQTSRSVAQELWGAGTESGIHQTWHQDADDLPHGTGDWWRGSATQSGGFTDVGDAERFDEDEHLHEALAMAAIAAGLARHHEHPRAFCNLWGVDYGPEVVDWWAGLLSAFGITWLVHTYGPTSYLGTDTGWGPGYPNHPTWQSFGRANDTIRRIRDLTGHALPEANVAAVYPIGTLARIGSAPATTIARDAQRIIARMVQHGIATDVISPDLFAGGRVEDGALWLATPRGRLRYDAVVYPHPQTLQPAEWDQLRRLDGAGVQIVLVGSPPRETTDGSPAPDDLWPAVSEPSLNGVLAHLPRLVHSPPGALTNLFIRPDGAPAVVITPVVPTKAVDGLVDSRIDAGTIHGRVSDLGGVAAARFDSAGRPQEQWVVDGTADFWTGAGG